MTIDYEKISPRFDGFRVEGPLLVQTYLKKLTNFKLSRQTLKLTHQTCLKEKQPITRSNRFVKRRFKTCLSNRFDHIRGPLILFDR